MGVSAAILTGALVGGSMISSAREARKARQAEQEQTEIARRELEALQRQIAAESQAKPMPDPQDQRRAKRRSIAEQMRRRGRASTMLAGDSTVGDPLG